MMYTLGELGETSKVHPACLELRRFRIQVLRISQTELAAMLGVPRETLARHETGKHHPILTTVERYREFMANWAGKETQLRISRWKHHGKT